MEPTIAELQTSVTAAETAAANAGGTDEALNTAVTDAKAALAKAKAPSQDSKRTEKEKAEFSLKKTAERVKELGGDPELVLGTKTHIKTDDADEDDKPVTVGMLREIQKKDATKTAIEMADEITDEDTKATVKQYLSDNIKPSGNAESDFKIALAAASASKNKQVLEEMDRFRNPKKTAAGGSMGARVEEQFTPTAEEQWHMQSFGLTKEQVLEARKKTAQKG